MYCPNTDGNLHALNKHLDEQDRNMDAYDKFYADCEYECWDYKADLEKLNNSYNALVALNDEDANDMLEAIFELADEYYNKIYDVFNSADYDNARENRDEFLGGVVNGALKEKLA